MIALEFVAYHDAKRSFDPELGVNECVYERALDAGVYIYLYPGVGLRRRRRWRLPHARVAAYDR